MASENPDVAVIRTLPATKVTVAGRACAKRMKTPYPVLFVAAAERPIQYGVTRQTRLRPPRALRPLLNTERTVRRHPPFLPGRWQCDRTARNLAAGSLTAQAAQS